MPTGIEWTDETWNPVTGCTKVSPGCAHCYISRSPPFRIAGRKWDESGKIPLIFHEDRLEQPLRWSRPRMVFVNSLSDLFHEDIPEPFIRRVFNVMDAASKHTFQILTKRPERMREVVERYYDGADPLPNVWLGVTIENARWVGRADVLRDTPAAVRFISAEPLLGSLFPAEPPRSPASLSFRPARTRENLDLSEIDWVICGGESGGRHVRPMHPAWARELRDACTGGSNFMGPRPGGGFEPSYVPFPLGDPARGPAFFFKQHGSYAPAPDLRMDLPTKIVDGGKYGLAHMRYMGVSGKSGGKLLDGREWCEMPEPRVPQPA